MANPTLRIGLTAGLCPEPFLDAIIEKIGAHRDLQGQAADIETACCQPSPVAADADKLVKEGSVKIQAYEECLFLEELGVDVIGLPNFSCGSYLPELQTEIRTPVITPAHAVADWIKTQQTRRIGYLGDPQSPKFAGVKQIFDKAGLTDVDWVSPDEAGVKAVCEFHELAVVRKDPASLGEQGLQILLPAVNSLVNQGVAWIMPTCGYQALLADKLSQTGAPMIDLVTLYANFLVEQEHPKLPKPFRLGIYGGLGPAATVDLYDKIVRATPAKTDQDHFKVLIVQNPQTPDRTLYLLSGGLDPTLAIFSGCLQLQRQGADAIVIPCNTAHAFIESITPHLEVPIVNMQQTALEEIQEKYGKDAVIGLMATEGTVKTGIYSNKAQSMGLKLVVPEADYQKYVTSAIYGEKGVKAGFCDGQCRDELLRAARHLVQDKGATVLILGCTELPLILSEGDRVDLDGEFAAIVDPTAAVARRVVSIALETIQERGCR